jgi:hypothetical protein
MKRKHERILHNIGIFIAVCCGVVTYLMWAIAILRTN